MDIRQNFYETFLIILLLCIDSGISSIVDEMDYFDETSGNRCPWIRNKLKNGRVRYRYKGRVAKFLCDSGFELAGKRSSTCVRGQWSNPVPVCVARGCSRVPPISNGRITEMYRGALLVYDCNPGYVLIGIPTIHCDGRRWNTSPPQCVIATDNPETYCDFENPDLCGWSQDPNHDFDWQRNQFATPSGHVGTGPSFDHTFGENKGGFYLYIEASSPRKLNDTTRIFSPVYSPDLSGGCFTFWYHMYGATTGGLRVYLKPESHVFDELKPKWEKYGDLGNQWLKGLMIVPVLHENFQIVIEGVRGESYVGDSAVDDVRLTSNLCDTDDNSTDVTESISHYSCRGRCQEAGTESSCGCNAHCVNEPNFCCRDYYAICSIGNFTTIRNTDEPPPEDYTTSSSVVTHSISLTTTEQSEESPIITTQLQTEKSEITYEPSLITSSTTSSTVSLEQDIATKTTENINFNLDINNTTEQHTSVEVINVTQTPSSTISNSEASLVSTKNMETTQISSLDSSTTTSSASTSTLTTTPTTTSSTTSSTSSTVISTTPQMISTTAIITTQSTTQSESITEKTSELINRTLTQKFDFNMTTPSTPITVFVSNATTLRSTSIFASHVPISTTTTTIAPNTEPISVSTSTLSSTRKTYNLRPRNRTVSTTDKDMLSTTKPTTPRPRTKITTSDSTFTTSARYLTSWYKYSLPSNTEPKTTSSSTSDTTTPFPGFPEDTSKNIITKKYSNRFTRPTKSTFPTSSNFYESKTTTTSNNSNVSIVVSIIIVILLCLISGLVYYFRKQRNKRQSKLSDDSEMRFLPDSDYMEYSDASALDRILVK